MTRPLTVIVLGVDTPIGLCVVRDLGRAGCRVHGIGRRADAIGGASRHCHGFSVRPAGVALADWLPALIDGIGAEALLAISESDLIALAQLPDTIGSCRILTPRRAQLSLVLDKARTLALAANLGIATPQSWQPDLTDHDPSSANAPPFPLIAKWADPNALADRLEALGLPLIKAERIEDVAALSAMLARYRPIGEWPLVQSFCPGEGVGHMLNMADGAVTMHFRHRRIHEWPPEGGVSTLCAALPDDSHAAQMEQSVALLDAMGWEGPAMVEYRHDPATGRFWLMEVNGRFWGSLPLASAAGRCFALAQLASAFPGRISLPARPLRQVRARFMVPETRRLVRVLASGQAEGRWRALASYVGGFFDPRMHYYVWQWSDPRPMLRDVATMVRAISSKVKTPNGSEIAEDKV